MTPAELADATWWAWLWGLIEQLAFFGVVLTLAIEFVALKAGEPYKTKLEHNREQELADTKLELARLATARVKLLTPESVAAIVEKLKPFAGTKFDIGHAASGREQWDFLWQLEPLFSKAGWIFVDWNPGPLPHGGVFGKVNWTMQRHVYGVANVLNVSIELSPESREQLLPAANAVVEALNSAGIAAVVERHPISGVSITNDAIHILVGEKQ